MRVPRYGRRTDGTLRSTPASASATRFSRWTRMVLGSANSRRTTPGSVLRLLGRPTANGSRSTAPQFRHPVAPEVPGPIQVRTSVFVGFLLPQRSMHTRHQNNSQRKMGHFQSSHRRDNWPKLLKHRLSNNVGGVKHFLSVPIRALRRARHFALVEDVPIQPKPARNQYSGLELSPTHASLRSHFRS